MTGRIRPLDPKSRPVGSKTVWVAYSTDGDSYGPIQAAYRNRKAAEAAIACDSYGFAVEVLLK